MAEPNIAQREQWNGEGGSRWVQDADRRDRVLEPVGDVLFAAAALQQGEDVLDIGCGCGVTTLRAAAAIAPGTAVGCDISETMLAVARARSGDLRGLRFVAADAQTHRFDTSFDVIVSRFGTMFFDDPVAAHRNMRSVLRPGGRLCIATWQPLAANDWLTVPGSVLLEHGSLPEVDDAGPGMFAQSDPSTVTRVLSDAGWHDIEVEPVTVELRLGTDPADATDYLADTGIARRVLDTIPPEDRERALDAVTTALQPYYSDEVRLGAGINLIHALA